MRNASRSSSFLGALSLISLSGFSAALLAACDGPLRLVVVEATVVSPGPPMAGPPASGGSGGGVATDGGSAGVAPLSGGSGGVVGNEGGVAGDDGVGAAGAPSAVPYDREPLFLASYVSHAYPAQYIRYQGDEGIVSLIDSATLDANEASFEVIPGLHDQDCISFRGLNQRRFLRHSGSRIFLHAPDDLRLFLADATYCVESGLADPTGFSFRSINYPDRFIRVRAPNQLWTDDFVDTVQFASESTFYRETAFSERN